MIDRSYITQSDILTVVYPCGTIMRHGEARTVRSPFVCAARYGGWEILAHVTSPTDYNGHIVVKFAECGRKVFKTKRAAPAWLASYTATSQGV